MNLIVLLVEDSSVSELFGIVQRQCSNIAFPITFRLKIAMIARKQCRFEAASEGTFKRRSRHVARILTWLRFGPIRFEVRSEVSIVAAPSFHNRYLQINWLNIERSHQYLLMMNLLNSSHHSGQRWSIGCVSDRRSTHWIRGFGCCWCSHLDANRSCPCLGFGASYLLFSDQPDSGAAWLPVFSVNPPW